MRTVFFGADNIITSLGFNTEENAGQILQNRTGIEFSGDPSLYPGPVPASLVRTDLIDRRFTALIGEMSGQDYDSSHFTRLEKIFILSISAVLKNSLIDPKDPRTIFVISSTKGNIDLLEESRRPLFEANRIHLWRMAEIIAQFFRNPNKPVIVSNACISGSVAIMAASRMISSGIYDHAVVTGGDIISEFVISGFQSFQALSPGPCRPFDDNRSGLSLGEGCGTVVLTADSAKTGWAAQVSYLGGASSNDANHISGPSRDGEGLYLAIVPAMNEARITADGLDFISAHGTATPYNDEMESLALTWAGLEHVPVNSFKGYIGHTLGAAGIIETLLSVYSIRHGILFKSAGYAENGVTRPLNVLTDHVRAPVRKVLKTASGFGGCNAAIVIGLHTQANA